MSAVTLPGVPVDIRYVTNLETLKWLAFAWMVANHWFLYVVGDAPPRLFDHLGALVFPMFTVALASGLSLKHDQYAWRILPRVFLFAGVAQVLGLLVRDGIPLNVIFTLGLGIWAQLTWRSDDSLVWRSARVLALLAVSVLCEFPVVGVLFVWSLLDAMRSERLELMLVPLLLLSTFSVFNAGSHAAMATPLVVVLVALLYWDIPRVRGAFYWIYAGQFPVYAAMAWLWG